MNGLKAFTFPAIMHMRLKGQETRSLFEHEITIGADIVGVGTDVDLGSTHRRRRNHVLRVIPFGIKLQTKSDIDWRFSASRMEMHLEVYFRACADQSARTVREDIALLAHGVFIKEDSLFADLQRS